MVISRLRWRRGSFNAFAYTTLKVVKILTIFSGSNAYAVLEAALEADCQ